MDETPWGDGYTRPLNTSNSDKIVTIIKNCLDEWQKRRDSRTANSPINGKKLSVPPATAQESDGDSSDTYEIRDQLDYPRPRHVVSLDTPNSVQSHSPVNSPVQALFVPRKAGGREEGFLGSSQYVHYHSESPKPTFINSPFLPDIYLASNGLSFNHSNAIALMPTSNYEPLTTLLGSDAITPVKSSARPDGNLKTSSGPRQENEEPITGYTYNPSERIERMFGISPPWR